MFKRILALALALFAASAFAAVDVNKATAAELDGVKGIGPALSGKIVDERKKGNFKDWTDFVERVKGVGEGSAAKLSAEGLTINGSSFKGVAPKPETKADAKADKKADKPAAAAATTAALAAAAKPEVKADAAKPADAKADAKEAKKAEKAAKAASAAEAKAAKKAEKEAKKAEKAEKEAAKK